VARLGVRRTLTATPLARRYDRGLVPRRRSLPAIPWERFAREKYPEPALALSFDAQKNLAIGEYQAIGLFSRLTAAMAIVGAPLDLLAAVSEIPSDELRHADLALRFAALCKGVDSVTASVDRDGLARELGRPTSIEDVDRTVVDVAAIGETLACGLLGACAERATDPVAHGVYSYVVADEVHHARLGWYYLSWRSPQWSLAERQRIADHAASIVVDVERRFATGRDAPPRCRKAAAALGVLDTRSQRATVRRLMVDEIVPALDALGLGASYAWERRTRVS
jgi:hypothetical protein